MRTCCPQCRTTFRITPDQLKARLGKVRCGHCQNIFNALDSLVEEVPVPVIPASDEIAANLPAKDNEADRQPAPAGHIPDPSEDLASETESVCAHQPQQAGEAALTESAAHALGKATGLILPRELTEVPGYSKWNHGVMAPLAGDSQGALPVWPYRFAAILLLLLLTTQGIFHYRSEIAVTLPQTRPLLETLCQLMSADLPLPRHVELISIESSDLQKDPSSSANLLVLAATLRNRASYDQAHPSIELSLTNMDDSVIARRVFSPKEYLPAKLLPNQPFTANSDMAIRLWIEARGIAAAGYRLYVFYP